MIQIGNSGACLHGARGGLPQRSTCQGGLGGDDDDDDGDEVDDGDYDKYDIGR